MFSLTEASTEAPSRQISSSVEELQPDTDWKRVCSLKSSDSLLLEEEEAYFGSMATEYVQAVPRSPATSQGDWSMGLTSLRGEPKPSGPQRDGPRRSQVPSRASRLERRPSGAPRPSARTSTLNSQAFRPSQTSRPSRLLRERSKLEDQVYVVGGLRCTQAHLTQLQLKGAVSSLKQSMVSVFDTEVWESCDVLHPDAEAERTAAERLRARAKEKVPSDWSLLRRRCTTGGTAALQTAGVFDGAGDVDISKESIDVGRELMELASQARVSVLDVEEVREVFLQSVPSGNLNLQEHNFVHLLGSLWRDPNAQEARRVLLCVKKARRRRGASPGRQRRESPSGFVEDSERLPDTFTFGDFFIGFMKWMRSNEANINQERCTLTRFNLTLLERFKEAIESNAANTNELIDQVMKVAAVAKGRRNSLESEQLQEIGLHMAMHNAEISISRKSSESSIFGDEMECSEPNSPLFETERRVRSEGPFEPPPVPARWTNFPEDGTKSVEMQMSPVPAPDASAEEIGAEVVEVNQASGGDSAADGQGPANVQESAPGLLRLPPAGSSERPSSKRLSSELLSSERPPSAARSSDGANSQLSERESIGSDMSEAAPSEPDEEDENLQALDEQLEQREQVDNADVSMSAEVLIAARMASALQQKTQTYQQKR